MKIRIGNDIRLNVALKSDADFTLTDIKTIKAYLINTNGDTCYNCQPQRYPKEPFPDYYVPDAYNTGNCDVPCYFTQPYEYMNPYVYNPTTYNQCTGLYRFNYRGFGYYPSHYCPEPTVSNNFNCSDNTIEVTATIKTDTNVIQVYFPAASQLQLGTYKLVLIMDVNGVGWNSYNMRTCTYDYGDVFELSDADDAVCGSVTIDVVKTMKVRSVTVTAVTSNLNIFDTTLLKAVTVNSIGATATLTSNDISKTELVCYESNGSISANQSIYKIQPDTTTDYVAKVTNMSAVNGQYCLVTLYTMDNIFDTVKISTATTIADPVVTSISVIPESASVLNGQSVTLVATVKGTSLTSGASTTFGYSSKVDTIETDTQYISRIIVQPTKTTVYRVYAENDISKYQDVVITINNPNTVVNSISVDKDTATTTNNHSVTFTATIDGTYLTGGAIADDQTAVCTNTTSIITKYVTTVTITPKVFGTTTYRIYSVDNNTIYKDVTINNTQSATGISDVIITYSTDGTTYMQIPLTGIINVNTGSYVYLKYTVNGTGSYTKTATWNDTSSTNNPRIIIPTKDGSTAYTVVADGDKNVNQTIIITAKTTTVNEVTGIALQYSTNGTTYSDVTSSAIQISTGSTVYLKYIVSGTGSYDTTANWNDLSTSTNPRSITPTIAGITTYTAVANGNKTIAASVSITASSTVVDKVTGIKIQFSTDGTNYTDVTSTIGANKDTTLYLKYVVEGTGTFDTTANWGDGVSTNPRSIDTSAAKTISYLVTSNGDATKTAVATVVVSESGDTNITKVNVYYKLNNQSDYTLVTKDITLNMVVGETGENIWLKYEIVSSSSSSSQVANWFIDGQQCGGQDTVYGMQMTNKDGWVSTFYAQSVGNYSIKSYSVTINSLGDIANNIKTFKAGYYKDNDSVTWVGEDTTVVCANTDVYHVTYSLELNTQLSDTDSPAYKCNWYVNNENSGDTSTVKSVIIS